MKDKIKRFGLLCKKRILTQQEHREFKRLEKSITNAMLKDELMLDEHIELFKEAVKPLAK